MRSACAIRPLLPLISITTLLFPGAGNAQEVFDPPFEPPTFHATHSSGIIVLDGVFW
ncbi:MAG: hypothetical protein ACI88G_001383 [Woeseiaceae bacterium]|jgi:hypothetical protein